MLNYLSNRSAEESVEINRTVHVGTRVEVEPWPMGRVDGANRMRGKGAGGRKDMGQETVADRVSASFWARLG